MKPRMLMRLTKMARISARTDSSVRRLRRLVVLGNQAADGNARVGVDQGQHGSKYLAADVLEVHVDCRLGQAAANRSSSAAAR